jgi:formylglycine-generating enzyme required for sulfatase activity
MREGMIRSTIEVPLRGGSWNNFVPQNLRSADRLEDAPVGRYSYFGFRCAAAA